MDTEQKTVGIAIKNRWTGEIIFQSTKTTVRGAVLEAIEQASEKGERADLTGADLTGADLTDANLNFATLSGATLTGATLSGADLTGANLTFADLSGADLTRANLTDANLTATTLYLGSINKNFEALCKAIKTIRWNGNTGADFVE
jgi:uncharacterized protein YjbI with pentapeptide repeats